MTNLMQYQRQRQLVNQTSMDKSEMSSARNALIPILALFFVKGNILNQICFILTCL